MTRPHLALGREAEQGVVERVKDAGGALALLDGEIGASDVADEQRVAAQHRPGLRAACGVDQSERGVLRSMPGRVQRPDGHRSELQFPAVVERFVLVVGPGEAMDVDRRAGRRSEAAVAGDVVGMVVGLEHMLDPDAHVAREREVLLDLELRVHDRGNAGILVADQVGRAAEVVMDDLTEDHRPLRACLELVGSPA